MLMCVLIILNFLRMTYMNNDFIFLPHSDIYNFHLGKHIQKIIRVTLRQQVSESRRATLVSDSGE